MYSLLFPAVFCKEAEGYSTYVPDIEGCVSEGDTWEEAYANMFDALGLCLAYYKENGLPVPSPAEPSSIPLNRNEFIAVIRFDLIEYEKKHNNKAIKKTLSIPSWLNDLAEEQNINFSGVLQSALKEKLGCN